MGTASTASHLPDRKGADQRHALERVPVEWKQIMVVLEQHHRFVGDTARDGPVSKDGNRLGSRLRSKPAHLHHFGEAAYKHLVQYGHGYGTRFDGLLQRVAIVDTSGQFKVETAQCTWNCAVDCAE